jgi:hypothetical protein
MKKNETYGIELPERSDLKYYIIEKYGVMKKNSG